MNTFGVLIKAFWTSAVTNARIAAMAAVGAIGVIVAFISRGPNLNAVPKDLAIGVTEAADQAIGFLNLYHINLAIPVAALIVGTSAIGDMVDDGTYVYIWLRPIRRATITIAAWLVTLVFTLVLAVTPSLISVAVTDATAELVAQTLAACLLAACAYAAAFVLVGHLSSRGLVWGIGYLLIYEQFIARGGKYLGFFAIHTHVASVLGGLTKVELNMADYSVGFSVVWLVLTTLLFLGLSVLRQSTMEVA